MLPSLLYLFSLSLLAGAQEMIFSASKLNITSCPITFFGQTYEQIYLTFSDKTFAVCFDGFYDTFNAENCVLGPQQNQAVFEIEDATDITDRDFRSRLPSVVTHLECTVTLTLEFNGTEFTLVLANFGTQAALLLNASTSEPFILVNSESSPSASALLAFTVLVNNNSIHMVNVEDVSDEGQNLIYADLSGCRYSGNVYGPNTPVNSDPATCTSVTCDKTAVLLNSRCGPLEYCQGNGSCSTDTIITCTVTGPSVIDFQGEVNVVDDRCAYSLLATPLVPDFLLLANFQERRRKDVSFLDSVTLIGPDFQIHLGQGGEVQLNDTMLTVSSLAQVVEGVELSKDQTGVTASFPLSKYQAFVFFDGYTAQITLIGTGAKDLSLHGLCANSSESLSEVRLLDYSPSGCEKQYNDTADSSINCTWAAERCNLLREEPFSSCNSVVDPKPYITACMDLLCNYPAVDGLDCEFLDTYDRACSLQNSSVMDSWRSKANCPSSAFCQHSTCLYNEFCAERFVGGETSCFCRAIFASKYTSTGALGNPTVCGPDSASLTLVGCLLVEKGIDYSTLHLNDPTCTGQMDEQTHMVTFSFDNSNTCGTVVMANGSQIIYKNTIVSQNTSSDIITRRDQVYIDFSCIQTQPDIKTMSFRIKDNSVVQHITSGAWMYNLTMKAYTDPALTQVLSSDYEVQLDQRIWVELQTNGLDDSLVAVVTDSCWATDVPSPTGSLRYDLIINGCPNPADQTVMVQGNGVGTSNYFSFNMFQFTGSSGDVYLNCKLHLCVIENNNCAPVCPGHLRRRRAVRPGYQTEAAAFISMAWIN